MENWLRDCCCVCWPKVFTEKIKPNEIEFLNRVRWHGCLLQRENHYLFVFLFFSIANSENLKRKPVSVIMEKFHTARYPLWLWINEQRKYEIATDVLIIIELRNVCVCVDSLCTVPTSDLFPPLASWQRIDRIFTGPQWCTNVCFSFFTSRMSFQLNHTSATAILAIYSTPQKQ